MISNENGNQLGKKKHIECCQDAVIEGLATVAKCFSTSFQVVFGVSPPILGDHGDHCAVLVNFFMMGLKWLVLQGK